jgi:putative transcription factor
MLRCEVCGREIYGQPYYRIIEGGKMTVCSRCAQFGTKEWDPKKPQGKPVRRRTSPASRPRPRSEIEVAEAFELVDNYGELIRKTRQRKGVSVEDFAKKISEKESVVKKLEKEQLNPSMDLIKKVQRELGVKLIEEAPTSTSGTFLTRPMGPRTLGDLIKIKVPKEEQEDEKK